MVREMNEEILLAALEIDAFQGETFDELMNEWKELKKFVKELKVHNDAEVTKKLQEYKKKYLTKVLQYNYGDPEYKYYKILLEYLGIDEYLYESSLQEISKKSK